MTDPNKPRQSRPMVVKPETPPTHPEYVTPSEGAEIPPHQTWEERHDE